MTPSSPRKKVSQSDRARRRPHVAEWFGHRVFPLVADSQAASDTQRNETCPFLTATLRRETECIKSENSRGVCAISAESNGPRQDWLVCPYRALDDSLLGQMVRRLYGIPEHESVFIAPAITLDDAALRPQIMQRLQPDSSERVFVYFQDKLGGEIGLRKTTASPELSFDITVVELLAERQATSQEADEVMDVHIGRYGVIELQTTDTHGSYKHAVSALKSALDLHGPTFAEQLASNPEWAGRKVEGPNISNVFKRTFYQVAFKFQVTKRDTSVGCVLALPKPVWDSWQPFLGAPELVLMPDGTSRLLDDETMQPSDWIYVFDIDEDPGPHGGPAALDVCLVIGTDAATLSRAALDIAPTKAVEHGGTKDVVVESLLRRLRRYLPDITAGI